MKFEKKKALGCAVIAARQAGELMLRNRSSLKLINEQSQHDIKLELDVRCQKLIERTLLAAFPESAVLGEEGVAGNGGSALRWVVDPIDGTVNFTYGVPHACVSIALQQRPNPAKEFQTILGVVYYPFCDELWTAIVGGSARLNGKVIRASRRSALEESIVAIGFSKTEKSLNENLPVFNALVRRVRKIRMMGAAALSLAYVASGRFDAYIESGVSLWDIAAAGLILECAGGEFWRQPIGDTGQYRMLANNGLLRRKLDAVARAARKKPA
jgi:myo-inositol-1(or 4)-monophosphatase